MEETFEDEGYYYNIERESRDLLNFDEDHNYEDIFEYEDPDIGYWNPFEESASDAIDMNYEEIHYYECWGRDDGINDDMQTAALITSFHEEEEPHEVLRFAKLTERMALKEKEDKENCKDITESEASGTSFRETALQEALTTLEKENEKHRESQMCKVCLDQEIQIVFVPCGHLATCSQCSHHLYCCPLCRRGILNKIRVYKS